MDGFTQTKCMQTVQTWSCDIFQSNVPTWKSGTPSWSWESQDHFMVCNEWINACNAIMNFGYMNGHSSHLPWLNYGCKIECLQYGWVYSSEIISSCWKLHHLQLLHLKSQVSKSIFETHSLTKLQNCVHERVSRGHL